MSALRALAVGDHVAAWSALGFAVGGEGGNSCVIGGVELCLGSEGEGIVAWSLPAVDGLASFDPGPAFASAAVEHLNGAIAIDHVVVMTPDFDRTAAALASVGMEFRRVRDAGGFRQGFRRVGPAILEVVEARSDADAGPARFWGLVVIVSDLEALAERLGPELLRPIKPAVQPGRRIATLDRSAGLSCAVAFMDPDPERR